jgi:hypothetical protein
MKTALKVALGIVIVVFIYGATQTKPSTPSAAAAVSSAPATPLPGIGANVEAGNWRYSVRQVDTQKTIARGFFGPKTAKGTYVLVWIDLTNIGKENFIINLPDFELRDDKGIKYTADYDSDEASKARGQSAIGIGEKMPPGVKTTTTLVFDVAPGTSGMVLYLNQAKAAIRLE